MSERRRTAAQFFMEEETKEDEHRSSYDKVVELLNNASISTVDSDKIKNICQVQELIVHKDPNLLDSFLDEVLAFQTDRSSDVRKYVVGFIEQACKKDPETLPKVIANVQILLFDESVVVKKRVIQAMIQLYRVTLSWICCSKVVTEIMETTWKYVTQIKEYILEQLGSENDGIRTHVIKFMEMVILTQTYPDPDSLKKENDFSLENVPLTLKIARPRKLLEESKSVLEELIKYHGSSHISSVNLMAAMGSLTNIAKLRPKLLEKIIIALESLHANLPPTLGKSQVSSVRKMLKMQLLSLLKLPSSIDYNVNITTLLTDLGATQQEVMRALPKPEEIRKRQSLKEEDGFISKKARLEFNCDVSIKKEIEDEDDDYEEKLPAVPERLTSYDVTEHFVISKLTSEVAADMVMVSMLKLPDVMPPLFSSSYTPIAAAGTKRQIQHVSRLLASQLVHEGLGLNPAQDATKATSRKRAAVEDDENDKLPIKKHIQTLVGGAVNLDEKQPVPMQLIPAGQSRVGRQRIKTLKLQDITKPLSAVTLKQMMMNTMQRILKSEMDAVIGGVCKIRSKIVSCLAIHLDFEFMEIILAFIFEDLKGRSELALQWLYEEYSQYQSFNGKVFPSEFSAEDRYNKLLELILRELVARPDAKERDSILSRIYHEAPLITETAVDVLHNFCQDEHRAAIGVDLLKSLVTHRPAKQLVFLNGLLELSTHELPEVRNQALTAILELNDHGDLGAIIEEYANMYLRFLLLPEPPELLFGEERGRPTIVKVWNEEIIKVCLYLYMVLLPLNHKLIHELAIVYVQTSPEVKRTILRVLEQPVRGMGMNSPELLALVETCPRGAETMITRVIHILTDKTTPSEALVLRVRQLYQKRVSDVRFLIPVLNGLTKKEVIAALPKLIKLNPVVVKEVFSRLLGLHVEGVDFTSPLTPAELLIALHNIDSSKCDMKTIIKATSLCFSEHTVYTQEVLAVVMQQLMDQNPLPTLLMRTVLQSLALYPHLIGFVMNILQRLILKQVWKQKKVWEGFIKCCQRTKPQSFTVLLQLPPAQLREVLNCSDLREPLVQHVMSFTKNQQAHISKPIMDILMGVPELQPEDAVDDMGPSSPSDELTIHIQEDPGSEVEPAPPGED